MTAAVALACPRCRGPLMVGDDGAPCATCDHTWPGDPWAAWLDLYDGPEIRLDGLGPRAMHFEPLAKIYEAFWRPGFVAVASMGPPRLDDELELIHERLSPAAGGVVLDASCGPGIIGRRLAASGRYRETWGLDLSRPMLAVCRAHCRSEGLDSLPLVRGDIGNLPFADGSLDGLHAGAALHLWPSPPVALGEVRRVLRPGGVFVATTFVRATLPALRLAHRTFERTTRVRFFERGELDAMAEAAGLVDVRATYRGAFILMSCSSPASSPRC